MLKPPFGSTNVDVPVIGQGTWQLRNPKGAEAALRLGLDLGLTHIDTAELYQGSEEVVGRAIQGRRDEVFLVSKVLPKNASRKGCVEHCRKSLKRLDTDYLDVYLLHWWENHHPIEETMQGLAECVDLGLTRFVGVSNFTVPQLEAAQKALGRHRIVCDQVYYDLLHRGIEHELLPYCHAKGIAVVDYSPFGSGRFPSLTSLAGRVLAEVAKPNGKTPYQVVLNYLTRHNSVFAIPKAETREHVQKNAEAVGWSLPRSDVDALDRAFPLAREKELPML